MSNDNRYQLEQLPELSLYRWFDRGWWPVAKTKFTLAFGPAIDPTWLTEQTSSHSFHSFWKGTHAFLQADAWTICCGKPLVTFLRFTLDISSNRWWIMISFYSKFRWNRNFFLTIKSFDNCSWFDGREGKVRSEDRRYRVPRMNLQTNVPIYMINHAQNLMPECKDKKFTILQKFLSIFIVSIKISIRFFVR